MHGTPAFVRYWKEHRQLGLVLLGTSVGATLVVVIVVASVRLQDTTAADGALRRSVCNTGDCVRMARRLRDSMNESVDPCKDFFLFACQRWDSVRNDSIWQNASNRMSTELRGYRDALIEGRTRATDEAEEYFVDFVRHCRNDEPRSTESGQDPVLTELDKMGGYPLFDANWSSVGYDWLAAEARLAHVNHNQAIFLVRFEIDPRRRDRRIIVIGQQTSMFPDSFLDNEGAVLGLTTFLRAAATAYRRVLRTTTPSTVTDVDGQIEALLSFVRDLNPVLKLPQKLPVQQERMTILQLSHRIPTVKWLTYFRMLTGIAFDKVGEYQIRESDEVIVQNSNALQKLATFMHNNSNRCREIANYIGYKFVINTIFFSPHAKVLDTFYIYSSMYGVKFDRRKKCLEMAETLRLVYYHHYFKLNQKKFEEPRALVLEMLQNVKRQFRSTMNTAAWIDEHTKGILLAKLDRVQEFVGYSDWLLNAENVHTFYDMANAPTRKGPFLKRLIYHRIQKYKKQIWEMNAKRKPETWEDITADVVNAAYHVRDNNVKVYAGMLLKPFLYRDAPSYVNYGTVGFVAGHEIIHAFDDRGTTIDEHGVNFASDPWLPATRKEFQRRMKSIVDFYAGEFQIDGNFTRNENLADMSASRFSFRAYKDDPRSLNAPVLPGFQNYTNDQLYFLSFASIWCNNNKYDNTSIHGPHSSRVNGPLMNLQEFSDTFKCPPGSHMNPKDKKIVWG